MLSMFCATAWPVLVPDEPRKKHISAQKRRINLDKQYSDSCVTHVLFRKPKHRSRQKHPQASVSSVSLPAVPGLDPSLDFPFLCDPATLRVIQKSKVLFLMRGLSGSGKSTIVKAINDTYSSSVVCSADDYFLQDGKYKFDASLLSSAHTACQSKAKSSCNNGVSVVIVDNTNVRRWEMKFYLELASHRDYVVVPVQPKTGWRWDPVALAARNKHGVDAETLRRKISQFDDVIPVYYAWFLNEASSKQLAFISRSLLKECIQIFPDLSKRLLTQLHVSQSDVLDWETLWGILQEYYCSRNRAGCLVHCTAKFCGAGRAVGAKAYHGQERVQNAIGQAFSLVITSICFSPRSVGARLELSDEQLLLFDKPEEKDWDGFQPHASPRQNSSSSKQNSASAKDSPGRKSSSGGGKKSTHKSSDRDMLPNGHNKKESAQEMKLSPASTRPLATLRGRSAHITLGAGHGFEARETNFDVLRLCDMEVSSPATEDDFVPVTGGKARYFGDGVCCVYFNRPMSVHTIYSGFY